MMKTKLCICIAELHFVKGSSRIYTLPSGLLVSLGLNTLAVITFSEKPAFPRGAALRITKLYAKNVSTAFAQGCRECMSFAAPSRLERSKSRYICDTGWHAPLVFNF